MTPAIFGLSGLTLTADERAFFKDADPAGYIVFGRNVESRTQLRALTDAGARERWPAGVPAGATTPYHWSASKPG